MKRFIYADNAATTQLDIDAFEAMQPYLLEEYGNASQPYSFARAPKKLCGNRGIIAQCIGAQPDEIFFTSGGTESNNWAIKGTAFLDPEKHGFITSAIEHHAILRPCADIERMGYPFLSAGRFYRQSKYRNAVRTHCTGYSAGFYYGRQQRDRLHSGHSSVSCHCSFRWRNVSYRCCSGGWTYQNRCERSWCRYAFCFRPQIPYPKGIGFLYVRKGTPLAPYASGGSQENHMRAGTENIASIVGMAAALKKCVDGLKDTAEHLTRLETKLIMGLSDANVRFSRNGSAAHIPGNISLSFPGYSGEAPLAPIGFDGNLCLYWFSLQ